MGIDFPKQSDSQQSDSLIRGYTDSTHRPNRLTANTTTLPANNAIHNPQVNPDDKKFYIADGYGYDSEGNLTSNPEGKTFTYNAENKQTQVYDSVTQTTANYVYDGAGKRVKKTVGNQDAGNPALTAIRDFDYDKNGNVLEVREYDWVPYSSIPRTGSGVRLKVTGLPSGLTLKRRTVNEYYNQAPPASDTTTDSPHHYANPASPRLRNLLKATAVLDAAGTTVSRSEFGYDDPNSKGNLTESLSWDSTKGGVSAPLSTSNSIITTVEYNSFGAPTEMTDRRRSKRRRTIRRSS